MAMNKFVGLNLIGKSEVFLQALKLIERYATSDATVLILGETGTGKELAARAIHYLSDRSDTAFVPINCGAMPDNLIESELFGHTKGAFTDAREARPGLVAQANGGTLFLDEIEAMSPRAQGVLLRFLQDKEYRPVGGTGIKNANVRIIGASNAKLFDLVHQGLFRSDLVYRLNTLTLELPPLRERIGDIMLLTQEFLARLNRDSDDLPKILHPESTRILENYHWPGNIRQLENLIQREFILAEGRMITICDPACDPCLFMPQANTSSQPASHYDSNIASSDHRRPDRRRRHRRRNDISEQHRNGNSRIQYRSTTLPVNHFLTYEEFKQAKEILLNRLEIDHLVTLLTKSEGNLSLASRLSGRDRRDICRSLKRHGLDRHLFVNELPFDNTYDDNQPHTPKSSGAKQDKIN